MYTHIYIYVYTCMYMYIRMCPRRAANMARYSSTSRRRNSGGAHRGLCMFKIEEVIRIPSPKVGSASLEPGCTLMPASLNKYLPVRRAFQTHMASFVIKMKVAPGGSGPEQLLVADGFPH